MSQQATMTMAGMGGPVAMNVGTPNNMNAGAAANADPAEYVKRLNTYIYDYFMRNHHFECARVMLSESLPLALQNKSSPNQRNGADDMDTDAKDIIDRPKDLPLAELPAASGPFLEDWWSQFWDVWHSRRNGTGKPSTLAYITHQRQAQKARSGMMGTMDPNMQRNFNMMNGMPADLKKAAMQNSGNMNASMQAQMARARAQQGQNMPQGSQMERQGSQMDARSGSPGSGGHPSPKRARVDGGANNPQMAALHQQQVQRPGQLPNNQVGDQPPLDPELAARTHDLIVKHNMDPNSIPPNVFYSLALQPTNNQIKSLENYGASMQAQMKNALNQAQASNLNQKGMPPNSTSAATGAIQAGAQGSPMPQQAMDGMIFDSGAASAMMRPAPGMQAQQQAAAAAAAAAAMGGPGGQNVGGSHALQDYQMQLMLLEQQNKRRLMMARQEQDGISSHTGVPVGNAQFPPNMSPGQGGPSPNPNAMQQGTPKMNNGPSPNGNLAGRGSPAPGGFDPNMPAAMRAQMMMGPNGHPVPRSNPGISQAQAQAEMFQRSQQAQMMNGNFAAQGMPPNMMPGQQNGPQPGQVAPNMTPRQNNTQMPPPPAPHNATGTTQPNSPAPAAAPPTPSQTAKGKPGAKKDAKAGKAANKKGAAAATPASESEQAPTPGSQAPVTPMQGKTANPVANGQVNGQLGQVGAGMQATQDLGFSMDTGDQFNMLGDFSMDTNNGDVLENFDFDAFLNNTGDDGGLAGFGDFSGFDGTTGLESNETLQ